MTGLAGALFALVIGVRFAVEATEAGILLLLIVPAALLAMEFGVAGGLIAAALAVGAFGIWNVHAEVGATPVGYLTRAVAFGLTGVLVGHFAGGALSAYDPVRRALVRSLERALDRNEFVLHFQPIVRAGTGEITSVEALVRWQHPRRGLIGPQEFIAGVEVSRLVSRFTLHTLELALRQVAAWREAGVEIRVDVNVSAAALLDEHLPTEVQRLLDAHRVPGRLLGVEITEHAVMADSDRAAAALRRLSEIGVMASIDDFGTGQSSLARLRELPVLAIKIDREFTATLAREGDGSLIEAMVALAEKFGLLTVAEGLEDEATRHELTRLGCDLMQGFLICPPLPADEAFAVMAAAISRGAPRQRGALRAVGAGFESAISRV